MVLSDTTFLRIAVPVASRSTAYCSFDGKGRIELRQGDYVTVEASQYPFPTVASGNGEWFDSVRRSLRWNVRGAVQKSWNGNTEVLGEESQGHIFSLKEDWDIDTDPNPEFTPGTDSGLGPSEDGDSIDQGSLSPLRKQMSSLNT